MRNKTTKLLRIRMIEIKKKILMLEREMRLINSVLNRKEIREVRK